MRTPEDNLNQWSATHPCTARTKALALFIIRETKYYVKGKVLTPRSVAAAAIFLALQSQGIRITQMEMVSGIPSPRSVSEHLTEPALRNALQTIRSEVPDLGIRIETFRESLGKY